MQPLQLLYICISTSDPNPGLDIIGQTHVDGAGIQWKDYGLKLYVSQDERRGARNSIAIKASLSGQFKLPNRHHFVSAIYELTTEREFSSPVTIEIQHCAPSPPVDDSLSFAVVKVSQKELPYKFELHRGGTFTSQSSYGSISIHQLQSILLIAIVRSVGWRPRFSPKPSVKFCAQLFYTRNQLNDWRLHLVMTRDLEAEKKVINLMQTYVHYSIEHVHVRHRKCVRSFNLILFAYLTIAQDSSSSKCSCVHCSIVAMHVVSL